jgi:hypothetical protein
MKKTSLFRWGDFLIIGLLLILTVVVTVFASGLSKGKSALITLNGNKVGIIQIGSITTIDIEGPLGITKIASDENGVRVVSSPCPHKHCIRLGRASISGQTVICVPNRVAIRIVGEDENGVDGVVG